MDETTSTLRCMAGGKDATTTQENDPTVISYFLQSASKNTI